MALGLSMSARRKFRTVIERKLFDTGGDQLAALLRERRTLLITTPTVYRLYGGKVQAFLGDHKLNASIEVVRLSEERKSLEAIEEICALSIDHRLGRNDILLAVGGGVCSDLVGLGASMIRRGIRHVRVPTTLVGQIDAGVGIKCGVNFRNRKNYLGAFHPPTAAHIDPSLLATLDLINVRHGLSEIIKIALVRDSKLFELIESYGHRLLHSRFQSPAYVADRVIRRSIELMLEELSQNPFETNTKRLVDMGHTFSPTLEEESGFSLPHGEAVAIDLAYSCLLAEDLGILSSEHSQKVIRLLQRLGLPVSSPLVTVELCKTAISNAIAHRAGQLNLVLPARIGKGMFLESASSLNEDRLKRVLDRVLAAAASSSSKSAERLGERRAPINLQIAKES
jgi:2-epi-5-epi-valiolone synthase